MADRDTDAVAGTYRLRLRLGGRVAEGTLTLRDDPGLVGVLPGVR